MVFNWFRGNKTTATAKAAQDEDILPPQIRKPQHAYRDARMSIPVAEREFYETIQARKLSSNASSVLNGKGKARSPLTCESGTPSCSSTPESSGPTSHNSSNGSKTDLTDAWAAAVAEFSKQDGQDSKDSTAPTSLAESSKGAAAREKGEE